MVAIFPWDNHDLSWEQMIEQVLRKMHTIRKRSILEDGWCSLVFFCFQ